VAGLIIGIILFAGFTFQTTGLQYTTPSRSAFITGLYVIFTPLLLLLLGRRRPSIDSILGAVIATVGLHFLTNPGSGGFGRGEFLTLLCAACFAAHLIAVDHYTRRHDPATLAFLQIAVVAALAIGPTVSIERIRFVPTGGLLIAVVVSSFLATALALHVLNRVQSWTTPTRAAVIFAAEPVYAGLTSWAVEGEILSGASLFGAVLILTGILTAELGPLGRLRAVPAP
jgi:drug/metabolite transporter (DMT)-like permease